MPTKLFVNLPVRDLARSKAFFTALGLQFFGQAEDMASVIISEHTQVMLLTEEVFASYARNRVADATAGRGTTATDTSAASPTSTGTSGQCCA
jgi:uncharacterized protein